MKMFQRKQKQEKIHAPTLLYLIDRLSKDNQLKAASVLLEISREFFPGDPRFACMAGDVFSKLDEQTKESPKSKEVITQMRSKL